MHRSENDDRFRLSRRDFLASEPRPAIQFRPGNDRVRIPIPLNAADNLLEEVPDVAYGVREFGRRDLNRLLRLDA